MGVHRTCGEPDEIKKNTHPKNVTAFSRGPGIGEPTKVDCVRDTRATAAIHDNVYVPCPLLVICTVHVSTTAAIRFAGNPWYSRHLW